MNKCPKCGFAITNPMKYTPIDVLSIEPTLDSKEVHLVESAHCPECDEIITVMNVYTYSPSIVSEE